ncbi:hypothetical protein PM082_007177 [Marasmius tenuissimus]|nr:hypothetical protein PM082_007177 [Marasmius tenuissimus]
MKHSANSGPSQGFRNSYDTTLVRGIPYMLCYFGDLRNWEEVVVRIDSVESAELSPGGEGTVYFKPDIKGENVCVQVPLSVAKAMFPIK